MQVPGIPYQTGYHNEHIRPLIFLLQCYFVGVLFSHKIIIIIIEINLGMKVATIPVVIHASSPIKKNIKNTPIKCLAASKYKNSRRSWHCSYITEDSIIHRISPSHPHHRPKSKGWIQLYEGTKQDIKKNS